jgi:hypothetical protein
MSNYSSVCSATNKIIDLFDLNQKVKVYSYKDEECFKKLWNFHRIEHDSGPPTILVVWDGIPQSDPSVNTGKYLTPIDWAVGYSLSIADKEKDPKQYPDLRIIILDVDSQSVSDSESRKFVYQPSKVDIISMPWIRIFSANATYSGRDIDSFFRSLISLGSESVESKDSDSDGADSASKLANENKKEKIYVPPPHEVCTPSTEIPFLRLKIDTIFTNLRKLVDSYQDRSMSTEVSPKIDDITQRYLSLKKCIISRKPLETVRALGNFFISLVNSDGLESVDKPVEEASRLLPPRKQDACIKPPYFIRDTETRNEPFLSMKNAFEKKTCDLEIIRNIWAASLTRPSTPGDSHAIANLVGPLLLMKEAGNSHVNALQNLMGSIELLPDDIYKETSEEDDENAKAILSEKNPWISWKFPADSHNPLKLILIDDMFQSGWGRMLCWAMGVNYQVSLGNHENELVKISECETGKDEKIVVKAASSAECILTKLEGLGDQKDKRFEFSLDDSAGMEILFLDLRLYPGDFKAETRFFEKLIEIAKKFTEGSNKNLSWDGFTNDEIESIEEWLPNGKQEGPVYIKALTLLPRILSLTDLSRPIILFSSTGRRDITEQLKPYGNIITVLEKPRFTVDIPVDIALQTKHKFLDAMKKAHHILRVRQRIQTISTYKKREQPEFNSSGIHVELFIDETYETSVELERLPNGVRLPDWIYYDSSKKKLVFRGEMTLWERKQLRDLSTNTNWQSTISKLFKESKKENEIYVGGVFAIFIGEDIESAQKKADDFDDDLVKEGIRYFDSLGYGKTVSTIKDKKDTSVKELNKVTASSSNKPDKLGFIRLGNRLHEVSSGLDPFSPQSADNFFRITLISLIEIFLCETLPTQFEESTLKDISVSVYAGTRIKPYDKANDEQMIEHKIAEYRLGMESLAMSDKELLFSISRNSIYPIVSDILSFHNIKRNIDRVSGVKLRYKSEGHSPEYLVCRGCKKVKKLSKGVTSLNQNWCNCKGSGNIHPDYRVLHYIADEILGHVRNVEEGRGYGASIKQIPSGFDDILNDDLKDTIKASRYLDLGETVSAIAEVKVTNDHSPGDYSVKPLLLQRIASKLDNLTGEEFIKLVQVEESLNTENYNS